MLRISQELLAFLFHTKALPKNKQKIQYESKSWLSNGRPTYIPNQKFDSIRISVHRDITKI